jgi:hypothetical protein
MREFLDCHSAPDRFVTEGARRSCLHVVGVRINKSQLIDHFVPVGVERAPNEDGATFFHVELSLLALNVAGTDPWGVYDAHV